VSRIPFKIERTSIASQVYDYLRTSILKGLLPPGTHLATPQIAVDMGISRSPVREAFRLLEADGLVEIRTSQGAFVIGPTAHQVEEIYTARCLIEGYVAGLAAQKATPADVERLRLALDTVMAAARRGDYEATVTADFAFHRLIWEIAGHEIINDMLTRLEGKIRMFMAVQAPLFDHLYDSVSSHSEVVDMIAKGDPEAAKASIQQHISEAGTLTLKKMRQEEAHLD
jgi:DNA-binding GntR family transcriptional regulator